MAGEPPDIVAKLAATGANSLYVDGGDTIQRFLRAGMVDRLIITRVPVLIGWASVYSGQFRTILN
jgi:riboflavin biosynthesis pyrimidine reductase